LADRWFGEGMNALVGLWLVQNRFFHRGGPQSTATMLSHSPYARLSVFQSIPNPLCQSPINKLDHYFFRNSINMVQSSSSRPHRRPVVIAYLGLISALLLSGIVDHSAPFIQCCEGFALVVLGPRRAAASSSAFTTRIGSSSSSTSSVIIEPGDGTVEEQDTGRGGVRLAQESVIKILGSFPRPAGGGADDDEVELSDLFRYTQVTEVAESFVSSCVIYTGTGIEYYQQPDDIVGTTAEVRFAPTEAVRNALQAGKITASNNALNRISINFCGGKDAQVLEVMEAGTEFARTLRRDNLVPTSTVIEFRSISDDTFPTGASCVTVVAVTQEDNGTGEETTTTTSAAAAADAVARGEVYRSQATGQYYTLLPEHINTAVE
jgi:hypothetical protein